MINKLQDIINKYDELAKLMSHPDMLNDHKKIAETAKEHSSLTEIVHQSKIYINKYNQLKDDEEILSGDDKELIDLVKEEISTLKEELLNLEDELKILLIPKDPNDTKNTILEIRSGTGGDEAALFASDLFLDHVYCSISLFQKVPFD